MERFINVTDRQIMVTIYAWHGKQKKHQSNFGEGEIAVGSPINSPVPCLYSPGGSKRLTVWSQFAMLRVLAGKGLDPRISLFKVKDPV